MTTVSLTFPGPLSTKRRRMRSGGGATNTGVVTSNGNATTTAEQVPLEPLLPSTSAASQSEASMMNDDENISEQKTTQTSKCKGATTIPIFLKKTYKMVDTCDPAIASWTEDGDMFVVKDPDLFATNVIPQYFDHNKFSSFARQLNFYGFRKMQSKPIRNSDFDVSTSKYVTFFNENFKRGRCDLLKKIQRSTRGGGTTTPMDQSREILLLRDQVSNLEQQISEIVDQTEERVRRLELEMLSRIEQLTMSFQQHQQQQRNQFHLEPNTSIGSLMSRSSSQQHQQSMSMPAPLPQQSTYPNLSMGTQQQQPQLQQNSLIGNNWDMNAFNNNLRQSSISSGANSVANIVGNQINFMNLQQQQQQQSQVAPPTLPPHPKQKQLPGGIIPSNGTTLPAPDRMNSLRGISTMSRGISGLTRGASVESSASAVLLRNSWEDKFFSMLMLEANDQNILSESNVSPTPINVGPITISEETGIDISQLNNTAQLQQIPIQSSTRAVGTSNSNNDEDDDELSDVSSGGLP